MNGEALPASGSIIDTFKKLTEKKAIKKEITNRDKIASLANSDSFSALVDDINEKIEALRNIPINPLTDTPESVGFRYLASQVTIEYLTEIRDLPERYLKMKQMEAENGE
jgi:hypothetical protein